MTSLSALTALAVVTDFIPESIASISGEREFSSTDEQASAVAHEVLFVEELDLGSINREEAPVEESPAKRVWTYSPETLTELTDEDLEFAEKNIPITKLDIPQTHKKYGKACIALFCLGVLALGAGLVIHPLLIVAAVLFICAIGSIYLGCRAQSRSMDYVRFQIKKLHDLSIYQQKVYEKAITEDLHAEKSTFEHLKALRYGVERSTEKYLNRSMNEEFTFTAEQLLEDIRQNNFFPYFQGTDYPYTVGVPEAVEGELYQDTVIRTCVENVLGLERGETPLQKLEKCICGKLGEELQDKAVQVAAFFKLLGEAYWIVPETYYEVSGWDQQVAANSAIVDYGVLTVAPNFGPKAGQFPLSFTVDKEFLPLCLTDNFYNLPAEERPNLAVYRTVREYTVDPVDGNGNIRCTIRRKFIGTKMTDKPQLTEQRPQFFNRFKARK